MVEIKKQNSILIIIFGIITLAINVLILVEAALPGLTSGSQSSNIGQIIADCINGIIPSKPINPTNGDYLLFIRKLIGHFTLFGLDGLFSSLTIILITNIRDIKKWLVFICVLAFGLFIALISEVIQLFTPGRVGAFTDVLIDFSGYFLFSGIIFLIYIIKSRKNKTINQELQS